MKTKDLTRRDSLTPIESPQPASTNQKAHTSGPWKVYDQGKDDGEEYGCCVLSETDPIADWIARDVMNRANARLIAAAPDFYREAVRVVAWLERLAANADKHAQDTRFMTLAEANKADAKNYRASIAGLKAAIAKAEGR